jgi:hypothetical protein
MIALIAVFSGRWARAAEGGRRDGCARFATRRVFASRQRIHHRFREERTVRPLCIVRDRRCGCDCGCVCDCVPITSLFGAGAYVAAFELMD